MKNIKTFRLTSASIMLAIIIVMQLIKNVSAYISGPVINAVMIIACLELGTLWGIGFSAIVPIMSLFIAPASPMSALAASTHYLTVPIIIFGNIILVLSAKLGSKKGNLIFIISLIIGAILKWLFMWGGGELILIPLFSESLGKLSAVITKVFSTLQLYSGLLSIILIVPGDKAVKKIISKK